MAKTKLTTQQAQSFAPQSLYPFEFFNLLGLDTYTPDELSDSRRAVYGRNFRLYAPESSTVRPSLTKRLGHTFYTTPVGETVDQQKISSTGASSQPISTVIKLTDKYTAGATGVLSRIDIDLKNVSSGTGPAIVEVWSDNSGKPGTLLATSSITSSLITSSAQYLTARFIEAPTQTTSTVYWVVAYVQSDGTNSYNWISNTSATTALSSTDGGNTWNATAYSLNFKTYVATSGPVKGLFRYYKSSASPQTLMAFGTNVYSVNDGTGAVTSIKSGLNASATSYDWVAVNDKTYFVNGYDSPQVWNGTTTTAVGGSPPIGSQIEVHSNSLFILQPGTNYVIFSDPGSYETFSSASFIYIPAVKTADTVIKMVSVQGTMFFFTRNTKYLLYGTTSINSGTTASTANLTLKESPASKGAVSVDAICKFEENTYFLSDDYHVYAFNGGTDQRLSSERVASILRNAANLSGIKLYVDDKKLYVSYVPGGQTTNNHRLVYDLVFNEWLSDEEVYTTTGIGLSSQSDTGQVILGSSRLGALYYGDTGYSDLGKPIKFDWWSKYMSFGSPAAKHRLKRLYAFVEAQSSNQYVDVQVDVDYQNAPTHNHVLVDTTGPIWGSFVWGSFTWGQTNFIRQRISVSGQNYKHQIRFVQSGVDNPVGIYGFTTYILPKRPV